MPNLAFGTPDESALMTYNF